MMCWPSRISPAKDAEAPITTSSPNGQIRFELALDRLGNGQHPQGRIIYKNGDFIKVPSLGIGLADDTKIGVDCVIEDSKTTPINAEYRQHPGKRSRVVDRCRETVISFVEKQPARRWQLIVRAYDDGVAFRYRFSKQDNWPALEISAERTAFEFRDGTTAFALPLNSFTTSYERRYERKPITEIDKEWLLGLPMLVEIPGRGWAAVTEANLTDYAGMYLARSPESNATMISRLSPLPKEPKVAVRALLPHDSPWRVVLIADQPAKLIESDLLLNLNEPCAIGDTSWIKTGKTTFPWWNGYYEKNSPFKLGLNTATMKYYIDFCSEAHIPYHSLDGSGGTNGQAWYGGTIVPYQGKDITKGIEGLDLQEVLRYAKSKGVQLRLWMHWQAAKARMAEAFPVYRKWGIEGVMLDFMDRDDQEMVNFQREVLKLAAENHLTVTFHGVAKPTGLERTYPNLLASEGVMNLEYDKWDKIGIPPEHDLTVPFTRMLAGPMDFHQGCFRTVAPADFKPQYEAPLIMGTPCRTLATYVVFQNHLPMVADYPSAYRGHPALPVLAEIPTTWDDTKAIAGEVGKLIVIARRSGDTWWVGAMNGREQQEIDIPLEFVGAPSRAEIWRDEMTTDPPLARETKDVAAGESLRVKLAPSGGLLVRLSPLDRR
jgi:alpha-glucosidase